MINYMDSYQRIVKECFWDLQITPVDIHEILSGNDTGKKKLLFEKILHNSTQLFKDISLFSREDMEMICKDFKIPQFNNAFIARRKNMVDVYFFNKQLTVDELRWPT